jgi:hypothetical protein
MSDEVPTQRIINSFEQPIHITLTKNAKGSYQWEISVHAPTLKEAIDQIKEADSILTNQYGGTTQ